MAAKKLTLSDVNKKQGKIIAYLLVSGLLGYVLARFILNDEALTAIFAPAINYIMYVIEKELSGEGYAKVLRK